MQANKLISGTPDVIRQGPLTPFTALLCLLGLTFWVLLFLKLTARITWSWPLVCIPIYAEVAVAVGWTLFKFRRGRKKQLQNRFPWLDDDEKPRYPGL